VSTHAETPVHCDHPVPGPVEVHHLQSRATSTEVQYQTYRSPGSGVDDHMDLLVLLPGGSQHESQWLDVGITSAADCLRAADAIKPMVIVMIDGSAVEADHSGDPPAMERLVVDEVLPAVRKEYPHLAGREGTSIGGISRGGGWALRIAADRPDLFSAVGGHSPASGLYREAEDELRPDLRVWLDVGTEDDLRGRVEDSPEPSGIPVRHRSSTSGRVGTTTSTGARTPRTTSASTPLAEASFSVLRPLFSDAASPSTVCWRCLRARNEGRPPRWTSSFPSTTRKRASSARSEGSTTT
jgi:hypothetical protein